MNAMILAAGLGTRLRPWTTEHPKALVPVGGVPMLERVILKLKSEGFDDIVVNIHHFGDQIIDFLEDHDFGLRVRISDERETLLDTGGGLVRASRYWDDDSPVLVHNVDILSNADLNGFMRRHVSSGASCSLLVSDRKSSRKLIFDEDMVLKGWCNTTTDEYRPSDYFRGKNDRQLAFSGIYIASGAMRGEMRNIYGDGLFPIMDYFLSGRRREKIEGICDDNLKLIDIGKPETLREAQAWM